jgi:hypothetical protein
MKKIVFLFINVIIISCTQNVWITQSAVRPKKPKFTIQKEQFTKNKLVDNDFLYVSKKDFISGGKNIYMYDFTGFYSDGKMIGSSLNGTELSFIVSMDSWSTAQNVGYYTTYGNKIKYQYFVPYDGGQYETKEGIIKKDTIIVYEKIRNLLKTEMRYDTLIKSFFPLGN